MKRLLSGSLLLAAACSGFDVSGWKGTWGGNLVANTGRQPIVFNGTLTISDTGGFTATSDGLGAPSFSCALTAVTLSATAAGFTVPAECTPMAAPPDGCTYHLTIEAAEATRTGDSLEATAHGRLDSACDGGSSVIEDYAMMLSATRK